MLSTLERTLIVAPEWPSEYPNINEVNERDASVVCEKKSEDHEKIHSSEVAVITVTQMKECNVERMGKELGKREKKEKPRSLLLIIGAHRVHCPR